MSKKQTALAISTTEAEYVSAKKACQQALWMKQALVDYEVKLNDVPVLCDNKGAIDLSKNPVLYSRTKHIEIRHHFLRDNVQKGNISIEKVASEDNIADILTKPLKREPFNLLRLGVGFDHVDKAQSTGLEESVSDQNKGKTSFKVKPNFNLPAIQTFEMIDKFERQLIEEKLLLLDDDGKPLPKVVFTVNVNSKSEVEEVLWEQWKETKRDDDYDSYDDDLYDSHDMSNNLQAICDELGITVCGRKKK
ncbi:hypothetical protein Tco_1059354 [Tanacetum coccineum]